VIDILLQAYKFFLVGISLYII